MKTCNVSSLFFKLAGSEFHEDGPETEKERGPKFGGCEDFYARPNQVGEDAGWQWMPDNGVNISQRYYAGRGLAAKAPEDDET